VPRRRGTAPVPRAGCSRCRNRFNHVVDIGIYGKSDDEVLARAISVERALITKDLDVTDPRRFRPESHFGILVVRIPEIIPKASLLRRAVDVVQTLKDEDVARNVVILEPTNVRFWRKGP